MYNLLSIVVQFAPASVSWRLVVDNNLAAKLRLNCGDFTIATIIMRCLTARLLFEGRSANLPNGEAGKSELSEAITIHPGYNM